MSERKRWTKPADGEWVQPTPKGYRLACCDCGLVHRLDFRVIKYADGKRTKVQFRAYRDEHLTTVRRRVHGIGPAKPVHRRQPRGSKP